MNLLAGILFFTLVVADLLPNITEDRKFGLEINFMVGKEGDGSAFKTMRVQGRQDGDTDTKGYVYYAKAMGSFKLHETMLTWLEARLQCFEEGGELASPETEALMETITVIMISATKPPLIVFTGISDVYAKGVYTSVRGVPLAKVPVYWAPERQHEKHNCFGLQPDGVLTGEKCTNIRQFICYKRDAQYDSLCGKEYTHYKLTHTCYKYHAARKSWSDAFAVCALEEARMFIANNDDEAHVITSVFRLPQSTPVHVGATKWKEDLYMTILGEPVKNRMFFGAPTFAQLAVPKRRYQNETLGCVMLLNDKFHKVNCTQELTFICEKTPNRY